jgi:hypothetical protein
MKKNYNTSQKNDTPTRIPKVTVTKKPFTHKVILAQCIYTSTETQNKNVLQINNWQSDTDFITDNLLLKTSPWQHHTSLQALVALSCMHTWIFTIQFSEKSSALVGWPGHKQSYRNQYVHKRFHCSQLMNEPLTWPFVRLFWFQPKDQTVSTPKVSTCTALDKSNIRPQRSVTFVC